MQISYQSMYLYTLLRNVLLSGECRHWPKFRLSQGGGGGVATIFRQDNILDHV